MVREHAGILHKVCNLYCPKVSDRQDLLQEMMLQLWKSFPNYRQESKLSTWIYRVVLNTAITHFRKEERKIPTEPITDITQLPSENGSHFDEQWKTLQDAITYLTDIEKAIVILYLENRSYAEMEDVLGINQGALRVKMNRIKDKLRQNINTQTD